MSQTIVKPGGVYARREKHLIWLLDCSGSMQEDGNMQALNTAIHEALPAIRQSAANNPEAELLARAITFSNGAEWKVPQPTPIAEFRWEDVPAEGETDLGAALSLVAEALRAFDTAGGLLPPALILISDGYPTDEWKNPLANLLALPWGARAERQAIAIGRDAVESVLQSFIGDGESRPLRAYDTEALTKMFRWVSTTIAAHSPGKPLPKAPGPGQPLGPW